MTEDHLNLLTSKEPPRTGELSVPEMQGTVACCAKLVSVKVFGLSWIFSQPRPSERVKGRVASRKIGGVITYSLCGHAEVRPWRQFRTVRKFDWNLDYSIECHCNNPELDQGLNNSYSVEQGSGYNSHKDGGFTRWDSFKKLSSFRNFGMIAFFQPPDSANTDESSSLSGSKYSGLAQRS